MRLDKFLKVSRIIKRRTVAKEACDGGRVLVNGKSAKASTNVSVGDIVEISFASGLTKFRVENIIETSKKDQANEMYKILE